MNGQHAIDELVLDLSFNSVRLTRHEKTELADWVNQEFLPQLDKLFSVYSAGAQILHFEQIKLDLGWLPARYYRQEIVRQTCAQLEFLIAQASLQITSTPGIANVGQTQGTDLYQQRLEQLLLFLRTGQLPFHRDDTKTIQSQRVHEQLLEQVLDKHNLLAVLRALPQRQELLTRLINQFSARHLTELLRQLTPDQFTATQALLDLWELAQTPAITPVITSVIQTGADQPSLHALPALKSLWFAMLDTFLNHDYINQTAKGWLMSVFEKLSQKYGSTPNAIAARLLSHTQAQHRKTQQSQAHQVLLKELFELTEKKSTTSAHSNISKTPETGIKPTPKSNTHLPDPELSQEHQYLTQDTTENTATEISAAVSNKHFQAPVTGRSIAVWLRKLQQELSYNPDKPLALFVRTQIIRQARVLFSSQQQALLFGFMESNNRVYGEMVEFIDFIESFANRPSLLSQTQVYQALLYAVRHYTTGLKPTYQPTTEQTSALKTSAAKGSTFESSVFEDSIFERSMLANIDSSIKEAHSNNLTLTAYFEQWLEDIQKALNKLSPIKKPQPIALATNHENLSSGNYTNINSETIEAEDQQLIDRLNTKLVSTNNDAALVTSLFVNDKSMPEIHNNNLTGNPDESSNPLITVEPELIRELSASNHPQTISTAPESALVHETVLPHKSMPVHESLSAHESPSAHETITGTPLEVYAQDIADMPETFGDLQKLTPAQARNFLANMLIKGDPSQLEFYWPLLLTDHPGLLLDSLKHFLIQPEIRQQLMVHFPLPILVDMLELYEPDTQPGFSRLLDNASLLYPIEPTTPGNIAASIEWWQRQLWGIILSSVIHEKPATSAALFKAVIKIYAAINNFSEEDLCVVWENIIAGRTTAADSMTRSDSIAITNGATITDGVTITDSTTTSHSATTNKKSTSEAGTTDTSFIETIIAPINRNPLEIITANQNNIPDDSDAESLYKMQSDENADLLQQFLFNAPSSSTIPLKKILEQIEQLSSKEISSLYRKIAPTLIANNIRKLDISEWVLLLDHAFDHYSAKAGAAADGTYYTTDKDAIISVPVTNGMTVVQSQEFYRKLFVSLLQENYAFIQTLLHSAGIDIGNYLQSGKTHQQAVFESKPDSKKSPEDTTAPDNFYNNNPATKNSGNEGSVLKLSALPTNELPPVDFQDPGFIHQLQGALANRISTTHLTQSLGQLKHLSREERQAIHLSLASFIEQASEDDIANTHWQLLVSYLLSAHEQQHLLLASTRQLLVESLLSHITLADGKTIASAVNTNIYSDWPLLINRLVKELALGQVFYKNLAYNLLIQNGNAINQQLLAMVNHVTPVADVADHQETKFEPDYSNNVNFIQKNATHISSPAPDTRPPENNSEFNPADTSASTKSIDLEFADWQQKSTRTPELKVLIQQWEKLSAQELQKLHQKLGVLIAQTPSHTPVNWRLLLIHLLETYHKHHWLDFASISALVKPATATTITTSISTPGLSLLDEAAKLISDAREFYKSLVLDLLTTDGRAVKKILAQQAVDSSALAYINNTDSSRPTAELKNIKPPITEPLSGQTVETETPEPVLLAEASTEGLLEIAARLKSGNLAWSALPTELPALQRLVTTYILKSGAIAPVLQVDLLSAINRYVELTPHKENYYLVVLGHLLAEKPLDLEEIIEKLQAAPAPKPATTEAQQINTEVQQANTATPHARANPAATHESISQKNSTAVIDIATPQLENTLSSRGHRNDDLIKATTDQLLVSESQPAFAKLAQDLIDNKQSINNITLNEQDWLALVEQVVREHQLVARYFQQDLLNAIQQHIPGIYKRPTYYREVLQQLLAGDVLDVEQIAAQLEEPINSGSGISSAKQQNSSGTAPANISSFNPATIYQDLRAGKYQMLDSGFSSTQWRELIIYLLNQGGQVSPAFQSELLQAIEHQAGIAVKPAHFYRHLVIALAEEQPLDLEAMSIAPVIEHKSVRQQPNFSIEPPNSKGTLVPMADQNNSLPGYPDSGSENEERFYLLKELLEQNSSLSNAQLISLQKIVQKILASNSDSERTYWLPLLQQESLAQRLIDYLPAHILHSLFKHLFPGEYSTLEGMTKLLGEVLVLLIQEHNSPALKKAKWQFIIEQLVAPVAGITQEELFQQLGHRAAIAANLKDPQRLLNLLQRRIGLLKKPVPQTETSYQLVELARNKVQDQAALETGIHLNNVGMVLMAPFMPRLFSMLKLTEQGKFIHMAAAERAAHILQYATTGTTETPEYEMLLNKVLCGMNTSIPIADRFDISEEEKTIVEQLLQSMIQHWKVLGSTSIAGLRQTFMVRQGWLSLEDDYWQLKVQQGTFDMLLDQLPWNMTLVKHAWMDKPLHVNWR